MREVLIVEDDVDIREALAENLRDAGYSVREAENGKEALDYLQSDARDPCLVLLDLMMPVMNGAELLQALHQGHRLAALPVVVVSAGGAPSEAQGARRFLRKPPNPELLLALVEEFCD